MRLICRVALILAVTANTVALANPTGLICSADGEGEVKAYIDVDAQEFLLLALTDKGRRDWISLSNFRADSLSVTAELTNTWRRQIDQSVAGREIHTLTVDRRTLSLSRTAQFQAAEAQPRTLPPLNCEIADVDIGARF